MKLMKIMQEKKISQYRLGKLSGVDQGQISRILAGKSVPGLGIAKKLASALGVTVDELAEDNSPNSAA